MYLKFNSLYIKQMSEAVPKWISEFNISDTEKEPIIFSLLKDYLDSYNKHQTDHILDKQNRIIIDERVAEKSSILQSELDEKSDELSELTQEFNTITSKCNNLYSESESEKQNKESDIAKSVENAVSAKNEFIQHLKDDIDSLKTENNQILSNFVKENNKSSHEAGVIGENEMLTILQAGSWDEVTETNKKDHSGDFIIKYKDKKYIIDVKNYTDNVPGKEVRKLAKDIESNSCEGGAIISLNSGIYNPNTNMITRDKIHQITVSGKSILLLSNASLLNQDFINSILMTTLYCESSSDCKDTMLTENCKREIIKSIQKMDKEIQTETISFQKKITRKQNDLDQLKDTLKEIIGGFDDLSDDDSPKPQSKNKMSIPEMRKKLTESGYQDEAQLKGVELRTKYNELF
jgi:ElaB/YqjD/DUF883 family membrane-anchored ribosome-binding protein